MDIHAESPAITAPAERRNGAWSGRAKSDGISVWLLVDAAKRPQRMKSFMGELAEPEFTLASCRESGRLDDGPANGYAAHWYCSFVREAQDSFADLRLLKRLVGAGFRILRFDGATRH